MWRNGAFYSRTLWRMRCRGWPIPHAHNVCGLKWASNGMGREWETAGVTGISDGVRAAEREGCGTQRRSSASLCVRWLLSHATLTVCVDCNGCGAVGDCGGELGVDVWCGAVTPSQQQRTRACVCVCAKCSAT